MLFRNPVCPQCLLCKCKPATKIHFPPSAVQLSIAGLTLLEAFSSLATVSLPSPEQLIFSLPLRTPDHHHHPLPVALLQALSIHQLAWPPQAAMALSVASSRGRPHAQLQAGPLSRTPHHLQLVIPLAFTVGLSEPTLVMFSPNFILFCLPRLIVQILL